MEMTVEKAKEILSDPDNYTASAVTEAKRIMGQVANSDTSESEKADNPAPTPVDTSNRPVLSGKLNPNASDAEREARAIENNNTAAGVKAGELEEPIIVDELTDEEKEARAIEENKKAAEKLLTGEGDEGTPVEETETDPGNTGNPTTDAKKITENIPGNKNNRHYRAVKSIWSAYYDGDFGPPGSKEAKEVAWYYTIDSLGKLASNIGRSLRNIGAAYVGGAIDDGEDKSEWQEHRDALRKEAAGMDTEAMGGAASRQATAETLRNEIQQQVKDRGVPLNNLINYLNQAAENADNEQMKLAYLGFAAAAGNGEVSDAQMIAMQATGLIEQFQKDPQGFMEKLASGVGEALGQVVVGTGKGVKNAIFGK